MTTVDAVAGSAGRLPVASPAQVRRAVGRLFAADRFQAVLVVVLYLFAAGFSVAVPIILGEVVDGLGAGWTIAQVNAVCAAILVCVGAQFVLSRLGRRAGYRFGERAAARLREGVVERVLALPLTQVERAGRGDLGTRTASDVNTVADMLRDNGPTVATLAIEVVVLYIATFVVNPLMGLVALVTLPPLLFSARRYLRGAAPAFVGQRAAMSEAAESLTASATGARTVASLALQEERRDLGYRRGRVMKEQSLRVVKLQADFYAILLTLNRGQLVIVVAAAAAWYFQGGLTLGTAIAGITVTVRIANPTNGIMTQLAEFQQGVAALARIEGVNLVPAEPREARPRGSDLRLDNVTFGYGDGPDVLHGLSLHPAPGERLVVVGPSGAGKSTIARLLAGIDRPRSGTATLGGVPVCDIGVEKLRRHVVLVTQEHYVFTATLRENLVLARPIYGSQVRQGGPTYGSRARQGAPDSDDARLEDALRRVDARWALAEGLDTMLGDEHRRLTTAEAQQIALARVVIADPDVVILDEATAGIDPASAGNVEAALAAALAGRTVIAIAHQLLAARSADRIAVVEQGRIVESGTHGELLASGGVYAGLWHAWQGD